MGNKLWILGMTILCTGTSLVVMDITKTATINPLHGVVACLFIALGLAIVKDEQP